MVGLIKFENNIFNTSSNINSSFNSIYESAVKDTNSFDIKGILTTIFSISFVILFIYVILSIPSYLIMLIPSPKEKDYLNYGKGEKNYQMTKR